MSLRSSAKELAWLTVRYTPGPQRTICLFCNRRGGSTWAMEIIAANRGVLPLNQPLDINSPNLTPYQYRRIPKFDLGQLVHPDPEQEQALREYADDLLRGSVRVNAPYEFWRRGFQFRTNRLLLKTVDAMPMIDWFDKTYPVDTVYLTRHPIPQALSCIRNGWSPTTRAFLRNEWFVAEVLNDDLYAFADRLDRSGTPLERFVLSWVLENLIPLRALPDRAHWLALSYEECVADQDRMLDTLAQRLGLADVDRMRRAAARLSRSSHLSADSARTAIRSGDVDEQIYGWRSQVTDTDIAQVDAILDRFNVTLYSTAQPMPNWDGYRVIAGR